MSRLRSIPGGIIFAVFISWLHFQSVQSQAFPGFVAQEGLNKVFSEFPKLKGQHQQLWKDLKGPGRSQERFGSLKELLKQQIIFSPLLESKADPKETLDPIFVNVTSACEEHFRFALFNLLWLNGIPETWVLQMFDAYGKIPSGILSGHTFIFGDYHECIQIRGEYTPPGSTEKQVVRGRYSSTYILPGPELLKLLQQVPENSSDLETLTISPGLRESVSLRVLLEYMFDLNGAPFMMPVIGTCFPDSCSRNDVQQILDSFHKHVSQDYLTQVVEGSYTEERPSFEADDYVMIAILALIGTLCLVSTLLDIQQSSKEGNSREKDGFAKTLLLAFSVYTNTSKWASTKVGSGNLRCLHGLRFMSMSWVVLCHTFGQIAPHTWNLVDVKMVYKDWTFYPLVNGTTSVDTFFTMSGALVAYNLLKELDKTKGRFNYALFVIHRYLRLTPTYVIIMGIMATLLPYLGGGPNWYIMETDSEQCQKYWWHNALYVNNLVKYETTGCYGESWYLANDMQFFLLSPLVIYPLWRWRRIGFGLLAVLSLASVIIPAWIIADKRLPPTLILSIPMKTYMNDIYKKPWGRFGPYVVGIGLGYVLHYRAENLGKFRKIPLLMVAAGWGLCTVLALGVIYVGMYYFNPHNADDTLSSFHTAVYGGLHRTIWGICIAWIVFACVSGYGGVVNKLLSLRIFMPLGRLTYCMYITSYHTQFIYHASITHAEHYSAYRVVNIFFAHMIMSGIVAFVLTLALESPFIQLEKMMFASKRQPRTIEHAVNPKHGNENSADINANNL